MNLPTNFFSQYICGTNASVLFFDEVISRWKQCILLCNLLCYDDKLDVKINFYVRNAADDYGKESLLGKKLSPGTKSNSYKTTLMLKCSSRCETLAFNCLNASLKRTRHIK